MKPSQPNACQIVTNMNEIISQKMNLSDANRMIIASTDEARIGTYHAGAKKLINEGIDELIINNEEGSINRAADKPFIHKNTLQNRLKQIQARIGYDPRSIRHSSLFYNALHFYREL